MQSCAGMMLDDLEFRVYVVEMDDGGAYLAELAKINKANRFGNSYKEEKEIMKCLYCDYYTRNKEDLSEHKSLNHSKQFKCGNCDKKYFRNSDLLRHMNTHTKLKKFICQKCSKDFVSCSNLKRHQLKCTN